MEYSCGGDAAHQPASESADAAVPLPGWPMAVWPLRSGEQALSDNRRDTFPIQATLTSCAVTTLKTKQRFEMSMEMF